MKVSLLIEYINCYADQVCNEARWKRAYGQSYFYAGAWSEARAFAEYPVLPRMLEVVRASVCPRANSALVNWYDTEHSIGLHADDESNLCDGCPVVSISWGFHRTFRLRPIKPKDNPHGTSAVLHTHVVRGTALNLLVVVFGGYG